MPRTTSRSRLWWALWPLLTVIDSSVAAQDSSLPTESAPDRDAAYLSALERDMSARALQRDPVVRLMDDWLPFSGLELGMLDAGEIAFDRRRARQGRYGASAAGVVFLPLSARFFRLLNVKTEFGFVDMDDRDPIENEVICTLNCFDVSTDPFIAKSDVSAFMFSAATGLAAPALALGPVGLTVGCNVGLQAMWPHREIDKCGDCDEEDLPSLSGAFLEPTLLLGYADRTGRNENVIFGLRASYREFITGSDLRYFWLLGLALAVYLEDEG